jgi:hypothetical protein
LPLGICERTHICGAGGEEFGPTIGKLCTLYFNGLPRKEKKEQKEREYSESKKYSGNTYTDFSEQIYEIRHNKIRD